MNTNPCEQVFERLLDAREIAKLLVERIGCTSAAHKRDRRLRRFSRSWKAAVGCKSRCVITFPRFSPGLPDDGGIFQRTVCVQGNLHGLGSNEA
jgi:hypothetical protein